MSALTKARERLDKARRALAGPLNDRSVDKAVAELREKFEADGCSKDEAERRACDSAADSLEREYARSTTPRGQSLKAHEFAPVANPPEPDGALECEFSTSGTGCGVRIVCDPDVPAGKVRIDSARPEEIRVGANAFHDLASLPEAEKAKIPVCVTGRQRAGERAGQGNLSR